MNKIQVLDKHISELIAAGEVIERPSSVVKELVENSIDAGANKITVEIKNGGKTYIRVTDNGCGIEKNDIKTAFLRNATSKIKSVLDLDEIWTLGFRGEALASICAVSRLEIFSKTEFGKGTLFKIEGGKEIDLEDCATPNGTTIIIKDLFFNVPARMKFLKKDSSESLTIAKIVDRLALSHPEISFKFIKDEKVQINTPGNAKLDSAIYSVYGKEFLKSLISVDYELNGLKVLGMISKPNMARSSRNMQHFFINGRYIKTTTAMAALEEAFKNTILSQKFPACILYLSLPASNLDVNVHPTKLEVRFSDEKPVFELVFYAVKTALTANFEPQTLKFSPNKQIKPLPAQQQSINKFIEKPISVTLEKTVPEPIKEAGKEEYEPTIFIPPKHKWQESTKSLISEKNIEKSYYRPIINEKTTEKNNKELKVEKEPVFYTDNIKETGQTEQTLLDLKNKNTSPLKLIGEAFGVYLIAQNNKNELVFLDKHAAHEKLIYDSLCKNNTQIPAQILLEPLLITLDKEEYGAVLENLEIFSNTGFVLEDFGFGLLILRAAPDFLALTELENTVCEMANHIMQNRKDTKSNFINWIYKNIACRAAIKSGNKSDFKELQELIANIEKNSITHCPHGRPIFVTMTKKQIEKEFKRL